MNACFHIKVMDGLKKCLKQSLSVGFKGCLCLFLGLLSLSGQAQITVSVNVIPPYSPYVADYVNNASKTIITLIPTPNRSGGYNVYFKGSIEGDNGVRIMTRTGYKPSSALRISDMTPTSLNIKTLANYFSTSNMLFTGVTLNELVNGNGLPEGTYTFCLQVFDYDTDLPLSPMNPAGCSAPLSIAHPDPPMLMFPQCASHVTAGPVQNILFNWSYNPGYGNQVQYLIKMVPVRTGQNPNDAINTMVAPAFFEKIVKSTSYLYGPSDPILTKGQKYAFRIRAFDPNGRLMIKNNGESEVCFFIYGDEIENPKQLPVKQVAETGEVKIKNPVCGYSPVLKNQLYVQWEKFENKIKSQPQAQMQGKKDNLVYLFELRQKVSLSGKNVPYEQSKIVYTENTSNVFVQQNTALMKLVDKSRYWFVVYALENGNRVAVSHPCEFSYDFTPLQKKPVKKEIVVKGQFVYTAKGRDGEYVLYKTPVQIEEIYYIADKSSPDVPKYIYYKHPQTEELLKKELVYTNEEGQINATTDIPDLGVVDENYSYNHPKAGLIKGVLVHGLRLNINSSYYTPLEKLFIASPNKLLDFGKIYSSVYTFNLKVNVKKGYKGAEGIQTDFENCFVKLLIKNNLPSTVPVFKKANEKLKPAPPGNYVYVGGDYSKMGKNTSGKTAAVVVFENLVCTKSQSLKYMVSLQDNDPEQGTVVTQPYPSDKEINATFISQKLPKSKVQGQIFYSYKGANTALPLNTTLLLKVTYVADLGGQKFVVNKFNINKMGSFSSGEYEVYDQFVKQFPDNEKTIGWTTSNSNGEFEFNVENVDTFDSDKTEFTSYQGGEFGWKVKGNVYRCLRIVVNNSYYTNPDKDVFLMPLQTVNVGKVTATVRAMDIRVTCKSIKFNGQAVVSGAGVPGLDVSVRRKGPIPNYFPANEGDVYKQNNVPDKIKTAKAISYGTSNQNGVIVFKGVVIQNSKDFEKLIFNAESPDLKGDFNYIGVEKELLVEVWALANKNPGFHPDAVFNADFSTPTLEVELLMLPRTPQIKGRVLDVAKSETGLKGALITLSEESTSWFGSKTVNKRYGLSDKDGYFYFKNLEVDMTSDGTAKGPSRSIKIEKTGYAYSTFLGMSFPYEKELGVLKLGEQRVLQEVYLKPGAVLKGVVRDESGKPVECYVAALGNDLKQSDANGNYEVQLPPGKNLKLVVWPKDLKYYSDTIVVPEVKEGSNVMDVSVFKRLHRFKVKVGTVNYVKMNGFYKEVYSVVPNSKVEIEGNVAYTNSSGIAELVFASTSTFNFSAKVNGPVSESYVQKWIKITNYESKKKYSFTEVLLAKGKSLNGKVTLDGVPLQGALVIEERAAGVKANEVQTDEQGNYVLKGIQCDAGGNVNIKVVVPKTASGGKMIIGTEQVLSFSGVENKIQNFQLSEFKSFRVDNFYGIPLEITGLKKIDGKTVEVKGFVVPTATQSDFVLSESGRLSFEGLQFKSDLIGGGGLDNMSIVLPVNEALVTNQLGMNMKYGQFINVSMASPMWLFGIPLEFKKTSDNKAVMKSVACIIDNSFDFPGSYLSFGKSKFFFGEKGKQAADKIVIDAFHSGYKKNDKKQYNLCDAYGKSLKFKFLQFNAESDPELSTIELVKGSEPKLSMATKITAHFDNMTPSDLEIDLGVFELNHEKILPLNGKQNIRFKLENWQIEVRNWQLTTDKGGITSSEGFVNAGVVNVPFDYFHMQNNLLKFEGFKLNAINLGNVVNLEMGAGVKSVFGYDLSTGTDKKPHWKMTLVGNAGSPAARFGNIEGLASGKKVSIEVLSLISNGEQLLSFGAAPQPLILYDVVKFKPVSITSYSDYFTIGGVLDLNIPRFQSDLSGVLKIVKKQGGAKIEIMPQQYEFEGKGYVKFLSLGTSDEPQSISDKKLLLTGTIQEPGETPVFKCRLEKNGYSSPASITLLSNQTVPFGSKKLTAVSGSMKVEGNDWGLFTFEGDLLGFSGVNDQGKHMKFTVYGDVKAEGQQVKLDNIQTPFGGMELTFDYKNNRMVGHMDIDQSVSQDLSVKGVANLLFDKGGFIIGVSAQVTAPVVNSFNAGMLIGAYSEIPQNFLTDVVKYNYNKNIPCKLKQNGLQGFFLTGVRELPLQVPAFSIEIPPGLGLVAVYAGATSGMEVQLGMNFSGGLSLDANVLAYAHAWAGINSITCTEASADALGQLLISGTYSSGKFNIDGCGSLVLNIKGSQSVPPFCTSPEISLATTLGVRYLIHLGSDGFNQGVEFSVGSNAQNCLAILNCN